MKANEQREVDSSSDSRPGFHLRMWQRLKKLIVRLAAIGIFFAATVYVLLCCYLMWKETEMVYPAAMDSFGANVQYAPSAKLVSVRYETDDGVKLTGRLLERPGCHRYLVFFHGNGERAKWLDDWAITLSQQWDASVLVAEYRGFDDSQYQPTEAGVIADGMAASEFMCQQFDLQPAQIIYYGRSLGGGVAVAVAAQRQAELLILDRTFDRLVDVSAQRFWFVPVGWLMRNRFDSVARISAYPGPVIQIHGSVDSLIPIEHGKNLFSQIAGPARWIEVPDMGHNDALPVSILQQIVIEAAKFQDLDMTPMTQKRNNL